MKIAFTSENNFYSTVNRDYKNMRTDLSWICSLNAIHYPLFYKDIVSHDIVICILPKKNLDVIFKNNLITYLRRLGKKIVFMQEGPNNFWQDYKLDLQLEYINTINKFDAILCHNESDVLYYKGLFNKPTFTLQSLMIEDTIKDVDTDIERSGVMIGGTMCQWYSGMDSLLVAHNIQEKVYAPSMGRKREEEDRWDYINYLPYMDWTQWINELNKRKYAIHLMRTFAAGTFSLNASYLGIPTIGYNYVDTQCTLHPDLSVDLGDMQKAVSLAKKLKEDKEFYNHCSNETKRLYNENYTEKIFLDKFNKIIQEIV